MCPNHHTEIDNNEEDWAIEKLHVIKSVHELWVTETLAESVELRKQAETIVISDIIDSLVELCGFEEWDHWTSLALSPEPQWHQTRIKQASDFRVKIMGILWPDGYDDLRKATITLALLIYQASQKFMEHSEPEGDLYIPFKFYKRSGWNDNYDEDAKKYSQWLDDCYDLVCETAKAANWFSDIVRRDINPMFFATNGKFLVQHHDGLSIRTRLLEFEPNQLQKLPDVLLE